MNTIINYYIYCLDRCLIVTVNEPDKTRAEIIIEEAYDEWQELDTADCCEEYICRSLEEQGITVGWEA